MNAMPSLPRENVCRVFEITPKTTLAGMLRKLSGEAGAHLLIELRINRAVEVVRLCEPDGILAEAKLVEALERKVYLEFGDGLIYRLGFDCFLVILRGDISRHAVRLDDFVRATSPIAVDIDGRKYYPKFLTGMTPLGEPIGRTLSRLEFASQRAAVTAGVTSSFVEIDDPGFLEHINWRIGLRDVRVALDNFELGLFAQPVVAIGNLEKQAKFEVLLRHYKSVNNPGSPAKILEGAAYNKIMQEVDLYVTELLCGNFHRLLESNSRHLDTVSINVSGASFASPHFAEALNRIVSRHRVPKEKLVLEITEDVANSTEFDAIQTMKTLKGFGYGLALDDIGTGSSNFRNLRNFPIDYYKIDRSYCEAILTDRQTRNFVKLIVDIGKESGKQIIAEGVPDRATLDVLGNMGVDFSQSFLTGRPRELIAAPKYDVPSQQVASGKG